MSLDIEFGVRHLFMNIKIQVKVFILGVQVWVIILHKQIIITLQIILIKNL